jgi:PAS domain S-box-containing protein
MDRPVLEQIDEARRFQLLVEAVTDYAIYLLDPNGKIISWNSGAQHIKGYASTEVLGRHFSLFFTEEDRAAGKPANALETARRTGRFEDEAWRQRKNGTRFWALVVLDAIRDESGQVIGFAKVTRDLSERREAEQKLEQAREQLFQAQKMEAIGQLTGGIAHDFNNLLTVIIGGADLAETQIGNNPKLKRLINNMRHAAERGESLTKQLLAFSRRQPLKPEVVDISRQLGIVVDLLSRSLRGDIQIVAEVAPELRLAQVDPTQLELALLNIGLNARDAMSDGGTLWIRARNSGDGNDDLSGTYVTIEIEDNGCGMTDEVKTRAFEPFFTTKEIGCGSGLGLSQAYGFAQQSGGLLTLESVAGEGTKVTLHLPIASSTPVQQIAQETVQPRRPGDATVLLVEDDPAVAELAVGVLGGAGYKIETAPNAAAALATLRNGTTVDLMFSDIMMPGGMNGAELARVVRQEFPAVFILLATGYAAAATALAQEFPLITKPYGRDLLLDKLTQILGETA